MSIPKTELINNCNYKTLFESIRPIRHDWGVKEDIPKKTELAWHFVDATLRDGSPIPKDGEWLKYEGEVEICRRGLHASKNIIDAMYYAPSTTVCRVVCRDIVEMEFDKFVCRERKILWRMNIEELLKEFIYTYNPDYYTDYSSMVDKPPRYTGMKRIIFNTLRAASSVNDRATANRILEKMVLSRSKENERSID